MRLVIQMSEKDVREILAKYFNSDPEDVTIMHKARYVGKGIPMENYIEVEVRRKLGDTDFGGYRE